MADSVSVRVPATSANLGPGFDALGVSLTLYNYFHFTLSQEGSMKTHFSGESAEELNASGPCLTLRAAQTLADAVGRSLPTFSLHVENAIPLQRGLGSSASAIIGGLMGANALFGEPLNRSEILQLANTLEGHPDNVAPSLLGGFRIAVMTENRVLAVRLPLRPEQEAALHLVACVPEIRLGTSVARGFLPQTLPLADAAFNIGRVSLLVAALCAGEWDLLRVALSDRLHESYRAAHIPGFYEAVTAANRAGAYGACLSGSGSTVLAFTPATSTQAVGQAMCAAFHAQNIPARPFPLHVDSEGTVVTYHSPIGSYRDTVATTETAASISSREL